jgi:hypothetical protein
MFDGISGFPPPVPTHFFAVMPVISFSPNVANEFSKVTLSLVFQFASLGPGTASEAVNAISIRVPVSKHVSADVQHSKIVSQRIS